MKIAYLRGTIEIITIIMLSGQKKKKKNSATKTNRPTSIATAEHCYFIFVHVYVRQMEQERKMNNETTPKLVKVYLLQLK